MKRNALDFTAEILLIIGGLNWGLYGLVGMNLVSLIFGGLSPLDTVVYGLVGLAALYEVYAIGVNK